MQVPSDEFICMCLFGHFMQKNFIEVFAQNPASPFTCTGNYTFAAVLQVHFEHFGIAQIAHKYTITGLQQKRTV